MKDRLPMSPPETLPDTASCTGSQGLEAGHTPSGLPDGTALSGPAPAPASRSPRRERVKVEPTSGTSGPIGSVSSASASLQSSLESKLRERLGRDGSTPYPLTWKAKVTPSGRPYCQLALSRLRTSASDCGLWPTPTKCMSTGAGTSGREGGLNLQTAVAMWPTPAHRDYRYPNAKPYSERGGGKKGEQLPNAVGGPLNPTFPAWLMGFPLGYLNCAPSATPLSRRSRPSS